MHTYYRHTYIYTYSTYSTSLTYSPDNPFPDRYHNRQYPIEYIKYCKPDYQRVGYPIKCMLNPSKCNPGPIIDVTQNNLRCFYGHN